MPRFQWAWPPLSRVRKGTSGSIRSLINAQPWPTALNTHILQHAWALSPHRARQRLTHTARFRFLGNAAAREGQRSAARSYAAFREVTSPLPPQLTHSHHLPLCCAQRSFPGDTRQVAVVRKLAPDEAWTSFLESIPVIPIPNLTRS